MEEKNQVKEFFKLGEVGNYFLRVFRKPFGLMDKPLLSWKKKIK